MKNNYLLLIIVASVLASCAESRKIVYLQNADTLKFDVANRLQLHDYHISSGDILSIIVTSSTPKAVTAFNNISSTENDKESTLKPVPQYVVDSQGDINFPLVGKLHVAGLTRTEAEQLIVSSIYPRYVTEKPSVSIHIENFRISVMGEVKNPGVYSIPGERVSLLEAIALAGDLTITGRRDNIMLIRRHDDGTQHISRINLNDAIVLSSPDYYLQQNDIVYVEPNKSKTRTARLIAPVATITVSALSLLATIANLIVTISR